MSVNADEPATFVEIAGEVIIRCNGCGDTTAMPRFALAHGDLLRCLACGKSALYLAGANRG